MQGQGRGFDRAGRGAAPSGGARFAGGKAQVMPALATRPISRRHFGTTSRAERGAVQLLLLGEPEGAVRPELPEVDPVPEPVEVVHARLERLPGKEELGRRGVASVVGEE